MVIMALRQWSEVAILVYLQIFILSAGLVKCQINSTSSTTNTSTSIYPCVLKSTVNINASRGYLISPNFPKTYGNRQTCLWRIQLSQKVVRFSTADIFELEPSSNGCFDKLTISSLTNTTVVSTQCGNIFTDLVVKDSAVEVKFTSDQSTVLRGFKILFEAVDPPPADMTNVTCGLRRIQLTSTLQRIVGGSVATPNSFPWQVALTDRDGYQYCGGTIVHPQWVVTAAHCMVGEIASGVIVKVGAHNLTIPGGSQAVQTILVHPNYNDRTTDNDIALLKLKFPVVFSTQVVPACVAPNNAASYEGKNATITGWGTLRTNGRSPDVLMQAQVTVMPMAFCRRKYPNELTSSMICAGGSGKDTCQGDSGGPMVVQKANGAFELIGITSWGKGCGLSGVPGIYTSVSYMGPWIRQYISGV